MKNTLLKVDFWQNFYCLQLDDIYIPDKCTGMYVASPNQKKTIIKETEKKTRPPVLKIFILKILELFGLWIDFTTQKLFIHLK